MRLTPNLSLGGQCEAAFKFYERCFWGQNRLYAHPWQMTGDVISAKGPMGNVTTATQGRSPG